VGLVLDRAALTSIFVQSPTDDLYLPGMPGAPFPDQTVAEPNMAAALELMAGRTLDVTMEGFPEDCPECQDFQLAVIGQLKSIGINVSIRRAGEDEPEPFEPGSGVDIVHWSTGTDFPNLVSMIGGLRDVTWLGADNIAELDRLEALSGDARSEGGIEFVRRLVDEEALIVPTGYVTLPMLLSQRAGCGFVQPAIGAVDLLSLCVEEGQ
jgi:hypothetical protein